MSHLETSAETHSISSAQRDDSAPQRNAALAPWWKRDHRQTSFWLFGLSLLIRLIAGLSLSGTPSWDGKYYDIGAKTIASGDGYGAPQQIGELLTIKPWCHYPVGYSAFLGGLYRIFGSALWVAPFGNAVLGALSTLLVHRIALRWLSSRRALIAALIHCFHIGLILYTPLVMSELLAAFAILLGFWWTIRSANGVSSWLVNGVIAGLGALVRPPNLIMSVLFAFAREKKLWKMVLFGALSTTAAIITILPWTYRNCKTMDGCTFISTNGGWNLAIGALSETGRFEPLFGRPECPVVTGQVDQDRCWGQVGKDKIRSDPKHWLGLIPKKLRHTHNHESYAVGYLKEAHPGRWSDKFTESIRKATTVFHQILMVLACLSIASRMTGKNDKLKQVWYQGGLASAFLMLLTFAASQGKSNYYYLISAAPLIALIPFPGSPKGGPVWRLAWGLIFSTSLTHAVFFGEDRYHMVISPILCLLAAGALRRSDEISEISPATTPN